MLGNGDAMPGDSDPAKQLNRRYLTALALVAVLQLLDQVIVQPPIVRLMTDAPAINLAGRQRMLSQRIAKTALTMERANGEDGRRRRREELAGTLKLWSASHERLRAGDPSQIARGPNSVEIRTAFEGLQPYYERIRDATLAVARGRRPRRPRGHPTKPSPNTWSGWTGSSDCMRERAQSHVGWLRATGWGLTVLIWVALVGIGAFVLSPASSLIERQVAELRRSRDELEARVRDRTRSLERLNHDLACEVAERAAGEERPARPGRAIQPRRADDRRRRDGRRPRSRVEPAPRRHCQLRRRLPRRPRFSRPSARRNQGRARQDPGPRPCGPGRSSSASDCSSPATVRSGKSSIQPARFSIRGVLPRRRPTTRDGPPPGTGTRLAKASRRPGAGPASAGEPPPERPRRPGRVATCWAYGHYFDRRGRRGGRRVSCFGQRRGHRGGPDRASFRPLFQHTWSKEWAWAWPSAERSSRLIMGGSASNQNRDSHDLPVHPSRGEPRK